MKFSILKTKMLETHYFKRCVCIFLTILSVCSYPIFLVLFTVLVLHRRICHFMATCMDPKVTRTIGSLDAIFACKIPLTRSPASVVCIYLPILQTVKLQTLVNRLKAKIHSDCEFPTLSQRIVSHFGYLFWRHVDNFDVSDHVMHFQKNNPKKEITRSELRDLCINQLLHEPFKLDQSPWECLVVENFRDENNSNIKSAIVLRYHHCLMDGHSLMKLLRTLNEKATWRGLGGNARKTTRSSTQKTLHGFISYFVKELYEYVKLFVIGPYYLWKSFLIHKDKGTGRNTAKNGDSKWISWETGLVSMELLKSIKDKRGVNFSSVIFLLAGEALRQSWSCKEQKVPEKVHCIFPYPMTSKPYPGLCNNFVALKLPLTLHANHDVLHSLYEINNEFEKLRLSPLPRLMTFITKLIGWLPTCFIPDYHSLAGCILTVSNFPGPVTADKEPIDFVGYPYEEIGFTVTPPKKLRFFMGCVSVNGLIRFHVGVNMPPASSVLHENENSMCENIQTVLDALTNKA